MKLNYKTLEKHQNLSAFLFLAILSLFLFFLTWQCWVDPNGDGGFNLYTFWQIAEGKILYRDLFYFHGPLAPLLYGLLFKIFGISILNIAIFNLLLTWASSCTIFLIFKKLSESITAIIMGGYFLCVFAIAKKSFILEHNFIFPYKPEIPLGALLVLAGIWTLALWLEHKTIIKILFLGIIMGCGLLLSVETLIATSASIIAPLFLLFTQKPLENKKFIAPFLVGFIIPILLCFTYFIFYFEWRNALFNTFASILQPLNAKNSSWIFIYTDLAGLNNPLKNFTSLLLNTGLVLFGAVVLYALSQSIYKKYWILLQFFIAGAILVPIFLFSPLAPPYSMDVIWWANYPKIFPLCSCIFAFCTTRNLLLERKSGAYTNKNLVQFGFLLLSLILLLKIFLKPTIDFYGFFLAMPSALSTVLFFSNYPPEKISRRSINSTPFRTAFLTILVSICIAHIFITKKFILTKENHIGKGTDESYNFSLNGLITTNSIVQWVESHIDQKEKILILPSGLIINYLARRQSPPIYGFHLFTQAIYGEIFLLEQLKKNSPPYIGIVTNIYNRFFGVYPWYGIHTRQWIEDNYIKVEQMGDSPFMQDDKAFGAIFYRRKY